MKLNKSSFTAKLYCWFYNTNILPKNFCPYFWKSIIAYIISIIFIVPIIFGKIYHLFDKSFPNCFVVQILIGILTGIVSFVVFTMIFPILDLIGLISINYSAKNPLSLADFFGNIGMVFWLAGGIIFSIWIVYKSINKTYNYLCIKHLNNSKESCKESCKKYLLIEYIKAFYHKHCPIIEWVENNSK